MKPSVGGRALRVGLNGFGRIGRALFRIASGRDDFEIVAVNELDPSIANHLYLLKYDSIYGRCDMESRVNEERGCAEIGGQEIQFYSTPNIGAVPWERHQVDVVVDASGASENVLESRALVDSGRVGKVVITHSPGSGIDQTIVFGVNEEAFQPAEHQVISTSICDANAAGPILRILDDAFGVESGFLTSLHPWLSYQNVLDGSLRSVSSPGHFWSDFALGRASSISLIPKPTTLVSALAKVMPGIASRLEAMSFRVPTPIVAACDMTLTLGRDFNEDQLREVLRSACEQSSYLRFETESLVSVDFAGSEESAIVDARWVRSAGKRMAKVIVWYDNEWGYTNRVADAVMLVGKAG
jgi:glyceraldehyde 3-phosphate dehydrogenase